MAAVIQGEKEMKKDEVNRLYEMASELFLKENYVDAIKVYEELAPHIDKKNWKSLDFFMEYGMALCSAGFLSGGIAKLELAVELALRHDDEESVTVTYSRWMLGEKQLNAGNIVDAEEAIKPSLLIECESKSVLYFLASRIEDKKGSEIESHRMAKLCLEYSETCGETLEDIVAKVKYYNSKN